MELIEREIKRSDMYYADLTDGIGSEQHGFRPVLIIQNDTGNQHSPTVIAAAITGRTKRKARLPTHILIRKQQGLRCRSLVLMEQLQTIDKTRLMDYLGTLDSKTMSEVDKALAVSVGLKGDASYDE